MKDAYSFLCEVKADGLRAAHGESRTIGSTYDSQDRQYTPTLSPKSERRYDVAQDRIERGDTNMSFEAAEK
jgi:hypothetical protein